MNYNYPWVLRYRMEKRVFSSLTQSCEKTSQEIQDCIELSEFLNEVTPSLENISVWKINETFQKPSQKVFPNWKNDALNIWKSFPQEQAKEIIIELHRRKVIATMWDTRYSVCLNLNTYDFFRDTNISISILDTQSGKETCIMWFFIQSDRTIELFQIQWKRKNGFYIEQFDMLIWILERYLKWLGFSRILILKSDKNYFATRPFNTNIEIGTLEEQEWLSVHKERMWMTYNARPLRKWWYNKPSIKKEQEWYSAEKYL